jgi:hypothetical protein
VFDPWIVLKIMLWFLLGSFGLVIGRAFITGFIEGLGIRRRPKFRVVGLDDDREEEAH